MLIIFDRRIRTIILVPNNQGSSIFGVSSCVIAVKKHSVVTPKAHRYIDDNVLVNWLYLTLGQFRYSPNPLFMKGSVLELD